MVFFQTFHKKKNKCLLSEHRCDLKCRIEEKIPCRHYSFKFPALHVSIIIISRLGACAHRVALVVGTLWEPGRFRWKLHPSIETWPLISTSNRGETTLPNVRIVYSNVYSGRWKKASRRRVTGLCGGKSPVTSEFPAQRTSNAENISIWWRHHV